VWQRQAEALITIFVTADEVIALNNAILCYLNYLQRIPAVVQECAEIIQLLQCFQWRLTVCVQQAQSGGQADSRNGGGSCEY
jgi:hypothetical protein